MFINKPKFKKSAFVLFFVFISIFFMSVHEAHAWWLLDDIAAKAVEKIFSYSLNLIFGILGKILFVLVNMLDWVTRIRIDTNTEAILASWSIMRDFANMLFIIILIVIAYGTIFNIRGYDFRSLIGRFIIVAVLVNFSLVICGLMIDISQIVSNTFLNAMGDISDNLGQGLQLANLFPVNKNFQFRSGLLDIGFSIILTLFFAIFFVFAFIVSIAVPVTFAFARIPILWALLIVSPMAWFLSILPSTRIAFDKWWKNFLAWNLFLPYYLFFLYFALYFLSQKDVILSSMLRGQADVSFSSLGIDNIQNSLTFGLIFFYVLTAIFLIGGTKVAMSASQFSGTGIINTVRWGRDRVANRIGWTAGKRAIDARLKESQEKEERMLRRQTALFGEAVARVSGGKQQRGAYSLEKERQRIEAVNKEREKQKEFANNIVELRRLAQSRNREEAIAARVRLMELGDQEQLDIKELQDTIRLAGGERTMLANQILGSIDPNKMKDKNARLAFMNMSAVKNNQELYKKAINSIIEKDEVSPEEIVSMTQNLLNESDKKDFLDRGRKKNFLNSIKAKVLLSGRIDRNRSDFDDAFNESVAQELELQLGRLDNVQLLEALNDPKIKTNAKIRGAFESWLLKNPKRIGNVMGMASGNALEILSATAKTARQNKIKELSEQLQEKIASIKIKLETAKAEKENIEREMRMENIKNGQTSETYKKLAEELVKKDKDIKLLEDRINQINKRLEGEIDLNIQQENGQ
jgi:hypothetical protein